MEVRGVNGARDKVTKRRRGNGRGKGAQGPLAKEGGLYLDICAGELRMGKGRHSSPE